MAEIGHLFASKAAVSSESFVASFVGGETKRIMSKQRVVRRECFEADNIWLDIPQIRGSDDRNVSSPDDICRAKLVPDNLTGLRPKERFIAEK